MLSYHRQTRQVYYFQIQNVVCNTSFLQNCLCTDVSNTSKDIQGTLPTIHNILQTPRKPEMVNYWKRKWKVNTKECIQFYWKETYICFKHTLLVVHYVFRLKNNHKSSHKYCNNQWMNMGWATHGSTVGPPLFNTPKIQHFKGSVVPYLKGHPGCHLVP
jgi:hypothetical protein